jgi:hypothetical protein
VAKSVIEWPEGYEAADDKLSKDIKKGDIVALLAGPTVLLIYEATSDARLVLIPISYMVHIKILWPPESVRIGTPKKINYGGTDSLFILRRT